MSCLLLVFVLLLIFTIYQAMALSKRSQTELRQKVKDTELLRQKSEKRQRVIDERRIIKNEIIEELRKAFPESEVLPKEGTIRVPSSVWFDPDKSKLKKPAKLFLRGFIPKYLGILMGTARREHYITRIEIEGHTDKSWGKRVILILEIWVSANGEH